MPLRVFVITCNKYQWALRGFAHQFNKYWSSLQPVVVAGYTPPDFSLPPNFTFHSVSPDEYPSEKWSTGLIQFLNAIDDQHFVLLLEDYWLCRGVNHLAIGTLWELCQLQSQIIRMDLTDDRQYNGESRDFEHIPYYGSNDIIWTPSASPYQMSLQAAIWNRKHLLEVLKPDESAWQVETAGTATNLRKREDLWVLGTRQRPVRYANVFRGGDASKEALNLTYLTKEDIEELREVGALE